jgi:4-hydroxybutyrate dehydrogenase
MIHVWHFPTRILFGEGALERLAAEVIALGGSSVLLVTEAEVSRSGLADRAASLLGAQGVRVTVFDSVTANPTERVALEASLAWRSAGADVVVALGGGAAMDIAKLVAVCANNPPPLGDYASGAVDPRAVEQAVPPIVAIPTTSGSGAEVSSDAFVMLEAIHRKSAIGAPGLMPSVVLLDATLTSGLSPERTAEGGFLALSQAVEAYLAKGDHPMADAVALEAIGLIAHHLERAVEDGSNLSDRGALMKAATLAGVAAGKGLGPCRSVAHAFATLFGLSHGLSCALVLPAAVDFARTAAPERVARIATAIGARGSDKETLAFEASGAIRALRRRVGLPEGLDAAGIRNVEVDRVAELAILDEAHAATPRAVTLEDMIAIVRASL